MTAPLTLSIIVPAYNEAATIAALLDRVSATAVPLAKEIIVVDDASSDATAVIVEQAIAAPGACGLRLLRHAANQGKGAAVRTGLAAAIGDVVLIQDADLEYDPADYPRLLAPLLAGEADVVYGNRFHGGHRPGVYAWHYAGNRCLTWLTNLVTGLSLSDMEVGYKAFSAEALRGVRLESNRFGFEPEITIKVARRGARIVEVPIRYRGRGREEGKKLKWRDGAAAIAHILRYRFLDRAGARPAIPDRRCLRR